MKLKRAYAPATIKHVIVLIRRVYNWASEKDLYRGENPAEKIKLPKINNQVTECLTQNEMKRLTCTLNQWKNQLAAMLVKFAIYTGLRRGELFNLKWDRVDLDGGWISLTDAKGGKDTVLPISNKALSVLNKAKELQPFFVVYNIDRNKGTVLVVNFF
jgi:site-specific recombinase XerD